MAVHFSRDRMAEVINNHDLWWAQKLSRPLVQVRIMDAHPSSGSVTTAPLSQANCNDLSVTPEEIIDALDNVLSTQEYLGDAYPFVSMDAFGPGVLSAFCGAKLDNSAGSVWFKYDNDTEIEDIHVSYDPGNIWAKRIKDIYAAGLSKWDGSVVMGFPDLGGVLDVAAVFRGSENLLLDLYDAPEEVIRLCNEIQTAWYAAYDDFAGTLKGQHCFTDWSHLLSSKHSYIIQCDFSYMIGNPMFREFALPTLINDTKRLGNTVYHLDGVGELPHLDDILSLDVKAVQWVYGEGKPSAPNWIDVYKRIMDAGKLVYIVGSAEGYLKTLSSIHGTPFSLHYLSAKNASVANDLLTAR